MLFGESLRLALHSEVLPENPNGRTDENRRNVDSVCMRIGLTVFVRDDGVMVAAAYWMVFCRFRLK